MSRLEPQRPWDPGLQPERTVLAWRRTCLALAGVGLLVTRLFLAGGSWLAVGVVVVLVAVGGGLVWWLAERRSRLANASLRSGRGLAEGPGGRLLLVVASCAFAVAVVNGILTLVLPTH
ncbi:DUF202 domain-containing protein [Monashia sp. NPDC004114]